jgi:hypothetical protein
LNLKHPGIKTSGKRRSGKKHLEKLSTPFENPAIPQGKLTWIL